MVGILLSYWGGLFSGAMLVSGRVTSTCWTYFGKFLHRCIVQLPTENQQMRCNLFVGRLAGNLGRIWTKLGFVSGLTEGGREFLPFRVVICGFCHVKGGFLQRTKHHHLDLEPQTTSSKWMKLVTWNHFLCKDLENIIQVLARQPFSNWMAIRFGFRMSSMEPMNCSWHLVHRSFTNLHHNLAFFSRKQIYNNQMLCRIHKKIDNQAFHQSFWWLSVFKAGPFCEASHPSFLFSVFGSFVAIRASTNVV